MEGVKYTTKGAFIQGTIGLLANEFEGFLSSMILRGIITARPPIKLSRSEQKVHSYGVYREWPGEFIPCSSAGLSTGVVKLGITGVVQFTLDTGLYIESIDEEDTILPSSSKMHFCNMPLTWIIRIDKMIREFPGLPDLSESTVSVYAKQVAIMHGAVPEDDGDWGELSEREEEDPFEDQTNFTQFVTSILDSFDIEEIRCKIVPLGMRVDPSTGAIIGAVHCDSEVPLKMLAEGSYVDLSADAQPDFWDNDSDGSGGFGGLEGF
jgi:hypothetical protein